ncbi:YncE family protein [Nitrospira sp. BLG_1]|uniref:YncE family protein n=1 Tax=Nitrospira sp. BLG_1 TaxID=3395883 RepID=UPI0039BC8DFA
METRKRNNVLSSVTTGALGLALISLAACNSGETTTATPAPGGSAGNANALVFVNNTGDKTLSSVALKGDSGNAVVNTIDAAEFENAALGDMQVSKEDWIFVNLAAANKVATIDPLTAATPVHEANLVTGTRPVHLYRDRNDGEVIWIMNDGDNAAGTTTPGDDLINCAASGGGSVTVVHNSHLGPGGSPPTVLGTTCVLADGHKVAAFAENKRVFVSSETGGEIAVLDGDETSTNYRKMIARIDLCKSAKETTPCNDESATPITTAFTPNASAPHGIRWSTLTKKVYSIQEGYGEIAEIDPATLAITKTFDLAGTPYTSYGISPDGKYLLLRGETTAPQATKLGVIDLSAATPAIANLAIPELDGTSPGAFKFAPNSGRFYILAGNGATATKKDRLFAFDWTTVAPPALTLLREIPLVSTGGHGFDVLAEGAGEAKYLAVSNAAPANSLTIINATDHQEKQTVPVGANPGGVMVFDSGAAAAGNQASN